MALRSLAGKLRVLPARAAASRAFASQMEKQCNKTSSRITGSQEESLFDEGELQRYRRKSSRFRMLTVAGGLGFVAFFLSTMAEALAEEDEIGEGSTAATE